MKRPTVPRPTGLFSRRVGSPSVALTSLHPAPLPPVGDRPAARRNERRNGPCSGTGGEQKPDGNGSKQGTCDRRTALFTVYSWSTLISSLAQREVTGGNGHTRSERADIVYE